MSDRTCFWEHDAYKTCVKTQTSWGDKCEKELAIYSRCVRKREKWLRSQDQEPEGFPPSYGACDPMPSSGGGFPDSFGA